MTLSLLPRRAFVLGVLIGSFYPLLGLKRAFSLIGIGLALWGWFLLVREGRALWQQPALRHLGLIFLAFWFPLWLAVPDAYDVSLSLTETLKQLLYVPIAVALIVAVQRHHITVPLLWTGVGVVLFWSLDALIQQMLGHDVFGVPIDVELGRIGAYWQNQAKFGYYMGFFGVFGLAALAVLRRHDPWGWSLAALVTAVGVLLGGNREAWLMFFPLTAGLFVWQVVLPSRRPLLVLCGGVAAGLSLLAALWAFSLTVRLRVEQSLQALQGSYEAVDAASSGRLGLWQTAMDLFQNHWLNGMGLGGFNKAFPLVTEDPMWRAVGREMYPHQAYLEIATTGGVLALMGIGIVAVVMTRVWRAAAPADRLMALPALLYLVALWFPLNTHRSFYSSELMMGNWLMLGLLLGLLMPRQAGVSVAGQSPTSPDTHSGCAPQKSHYQ